MYTTLIDKEQLHYMQAWVKTFSDGTEVLQSYSTDVVKKTPDGKYIRLWHSWSVSTNRHVSTWCGCHFRSLPYEDGTYEDLTPAKIRKGFDLFRHQKARREVEDIQKYFIPNIKNMIKEKNMSWIINMYNSAYNKELMTIYKKNKKLSNLFKLMYICAKRKAVNSPLGIVAKIHDFDFYKAYDSTLKKDFKNWH